MVYTSHTHGFRASLVCKDKNRPTWLLHTFFWNYCSPVRLWDINYPASKDCKWSGTGVYKQVLRGTHHTSTYSLGFSLASRSNKVSAILLPMRQEDAPQPQRSQWAPIPATKSVFLSHGIRNTRGLLRKVDDGIHHISIVWPTGIMLTL